MLQDLRSKIVGGVLAPGQQLPTRVELTEQYQISSKTLQQVLTRLIDDGFVRADRRNGTFVIEHPPHLSRYGLVFPLTAIESRRSLHWQALLDAAQALTTEPSRVFATYSGLMHPGETSDYTSLCYDLQAQRVAGIIFASVPGGLVETPVLQQDGIPRVAISATPVDPGVACIHYNFDSFIQRALTHLHRRGRRRIGLFMFSGWGAETIALSHPIRQAAHALGMTIDDRWVQGAAVHAPQLTANSVRLLMSLPRAERPDSLIITDDNIVQHVTHGLALAGISVPSELDVVAYTNFPTPAPAAVPVYRVGYDMRASLSQAITYISAVRAGEKPPMTMHVTATSDDEM